MSDPEDISKSARKRAAHAAQEFGEQLVALKDAELEGLALPEVLFEAIREARRISSRAALARQRQYIGRLMRELDLTPVRAALEARELAAARAAQKFRDLEAWRERLLTDATALDELLGKHPQLPAAEWRRAVDLARRERASRPGAGAAQRALFRMLRSLLG